MATVSTGTATVSSTYDALGRMVENNAGGTYTQIVYGPTGKKLATANAQTLVKAFIALPGGAKAIYNSSGLAYYRHSDWLGSSRLTSTAARGLYSSSAYAPFGEQYQAAGTTDASFTGQDQDTVPSLNDFWFRRHSPSQGRWISPDPAGLGAVSPVNPQSWNRYAYVVNNPMAATDPTGMDTADGDPCGAATGIPGQGGCDTSGDFPSFANDQSGDPPSPLNIPLPPAPMPDFGPNAPPPVPLLGQTASVDGGSPDDVPLFATTDANGFLFPASYSGPAANNGTPQQTARQKCLSQAYSAPEGKAVQFLSPVSLTPLNPNWQANWGEWGVALFGKGGGMFGSGIGTDTGIQTLNGVQNVGSWLENTTGSVLKVGEEVAPFAMAGAALLDLAIQAQCALDPSAPPEGIPIAPK
jgi:RHS repeat-associated protein